MGQKRPPRHPLRSGNALTRYSEAKHAAAQAEIDFAGEAISKSDRDKAREAETAAKAYFKHAATTRNATRINSFISLSIPSFLIRPTSWTPTRLT